MIFFMALFLSVERDTLPADVWNNAPAAMMGG
jgi:hypothetical protein